MSPVAGAVPPGLTFPGPIASTLEPGATLRNMGLPVA